MPSTNSTTTQAKPAAIAPNATAKAKAMAQAQIKANNLVWVNGYGYKGLRTAPIKQATGLSARALYLAITGGLMPQAQRITGAALNSANLGATVTACIAGGNSWGYVMARTGLSLHAVQTAYTVHTGLQATGKRNGRGGRMAQGGTGKPLAHLYRGAGKATGVQVPKGKPIAQAKPTVKPNPKVVGVAVQPTSTSKR